MLIRVIHIFVATVLLAGMPLVAANHYIVSGISGTHTGVDWSTACSDFTGSCAISSMVRGDTYYVGGGSYGSYNFNTTASGTTVITIKKATVADHGTDTGWSDTYGTTQATFATQVQFSTSYWVFDGATGGGPGNWKTGFGFKITNTAATPNLLIGTTFNGSGPSNVIVRHIELQGNRNSTGGGGEGQDSVAIWGGSNDTISYYYAHDAGRCIFFISTITFIAEYGYTGTYTFTEAAHAELASVWGFAVASNAITFRYNWFSYIEGVGGLMFDNQENPTGSGMQVYGNIFAPDGTAWSPSGNGVVGGWTGAGGEEFHNVSVYNNTFANIPSGIPPLGTLPTVFSGNIAENNIFYNCSDGVNFSKFATHDYDWFFGSGSFSESHGQAGSGNPFVATGDYHLTAHTNPGITLSSPYNVDMDGVSRSASGNWDRGALEFVSDPPPTTTSIGISGASTVSGKFSLQ